MSRLRALIDLHSELIDLESLAEKQEVETRFRAFDDDELEHK